jgi:hypothetical protein
MTRPNVLRDTIAKFGREAGFIKHSGSWYLRQAETIAVIELQKSQYGVQYYVNVALWLLPLGEAQYPKERHCHVRTRLTRSASEQEDRSKALLDLESPIDDSARAAELSELLVSHLLPILRACSSVRGLKSAEGERLLKASLVTGPAQQLLLTIQP